jgi:hypothetical protein
LKKSLLELLPFIDFVTRFMAKVFELPGLPVMNKGILFIKQVKITKMFSFRGVFLPIPGGIYISSKKHLYSSLRISSMRSLVKVYVILRDSSDNKSLNLSFKKLF